jgi:MFS family permease
MYLGTIAPLIAVASMFALFVASLLRAKSNTKSPDVRPQERRLYAMYLPIGAAVSLAIPAWVPPTTLYIALTTISVSLLVLFVCIKRREEKLDHYEAGSEILLLSLLCTMLLWGVHGLFPTQDPVANVLLMIMPLPATMSVVGVGWTFVGLILRRRDRRRSA